MERYEQAKENANTVSENARYGWNWGCDNCGDAGMSVYVDPCPECGHFRCINCETVRVKYPSEKVFIGIQRTKLIEPAYQNHIFAPKRPSTAHGPGTPDEFS
jgi:hypothetical protein